jgi:hypothetical protein
VAEHDGLPLSPILVENLDAIFRFDDIHCQGSLVVVVRGGRLSRCRGK